ncbi:hypothetical protein AVEN_168278-1 [Araneus ventricosus]|uniref:Uncharacterized protein n=1 Tax=Araneus ventricosus TaxID=182803 RepID=A0A4Y2FXP5_ARAVE|nr:hypothetical protein AVEN_168278-1 [Araneus ventricosus]
MIQNAFQINSFRRFVTSFGPRWFSDKVSASGPQASMFANRRSTEYVDLLHVKSDVRGKTSSRRCGAEVQRGGVSALVSSSSSVQSLFQNRPRVALRGDTTVKPRKFSIL